MQTTCNIQDTKFPYLYITLVEFLHLEYLYSCVYSCSICVKKQAHPFVVPESDFKLIKVQWDLKLARVCDGNVLHFVFDTHTHTHTHQLSVRK